MPFKPYLYPSPWLGSAWKFAVALLLVAEVLATRIDGKLRLDDAKSELVLTEIRSDGGPGRKEAVLPIHPAGAVRANLGKWQYNILPLSKRP